MNNVVNLPETQQTSELKINSKKISIKSFKISIRCKRSTIYILYLKKSTTYIFFK